MATLLSFDLRDPLSRKPAEMEATEVSAGVYRLVVDTEGGISESTTATTFTTGSKTVAAADTPEALGTGLVEAVLIINRTGSDIYWGDANGQTRRIVDGDEYALAAVAGKKVDLATIYVSVGNDGNTVDFITAN